MLFLVHKILPRVFGCLILLSLAKGSVKAAKRYPLSDTVCVSESDDSNGYCDIILFRKKLIAVGTDGRIDCFSKSGEIIPADRSFAFKLNCAFANDNIMIAAGDHGTILYSTDGQHFSRAESGTDKNIYDITCKNGLILAGTDKGFILVSKDGKSWSSMQTGAKGNILSLSANNSFFISITNEGEIIKSFDGFDWKIQDYNKEYAGYSPHSNFKKILATKNSIVIVGIHDDGSPSILFSSLGNVWAERAPFYYDDEDMLCHLTERPNSLVYDPIRDQFILACDHGELFSLPSCTKCNEHIKISDKDLYAIAYADNCLFIVGEEFSVFVQRF